MSPPILSKPSRAAHLAIAFITIGSLIMVSCAVWYVWMINHLPTDAAGTHNDAPFYWCALFFFNGLTLFLIGLAVGSIGRAARKAELPPEVPPGEMTAQPAVTAPAPQAAAPYSPAARPGQVAIPGQPLATTVNPTVPTVAPTAPTARVR
ncbi:MAG TPA: hypothetical protein VMS17_09290 [Gemmataceae bacterium]|nr:hypothetical protein [Gemmataceae bacterium]